MWRLLIKFSADCNDNSSLVSTGAVPFWSDANRPQLLQLPLPSRYVFISPSFDYEFTPLLDSGKIALVDFGATREYSSEFLDGWRRLLEAAASLDLNDSSESYSSAWDACVQ